ncbi:MAG TPA: hypothetical protein DEO70_12165 [Bacteroidales bacterium]|nr:MAG: hypothetical protein A2X11_10155 [Bacteroidetes bacterium GWE2_42_24]OFY25873.1 MAG: hypothetical protein A2X09_09530 [Bacteroidetes bacterium GWF2_43_11]HBZ67583.1 hypothetical protein [Bacteroidales bacterium]
MNPKWNRVMKAALGLIGMSSFTLKDGKLDLPEEKRTKLESSFGKPFTQSLEKHLAETEAGTTTEEAELNDAEFQALTTELMNEAMQALQSQVSTLQAKVDEAAATIAAQKETIGILAAQPEPDVPATNATNPHAMNTAPFKPDMTLVHNRMWEAQQKGMSFEMADATMQIDAIKTEFAKIPAGELTRIKKKLVDRTETMKYMTSVQTSESVYRAAQASMTHVVQQMIGAWTPLGQATFTPMSIPMRHHKINVPLVPAEVIDTWLAKLYDESKTPAQMPLVTFMMDIIIDKAMDDREMLQVMIGEYVAYDSTPADGTPGQATEKSVDGLLTLLRKEYENPDTKIHFVILGEITEANVVDKMKKFRKSLPRELIRKKMDVLISEDLRGMYKDSYQTLFPNTKNEDENNFRLDHSQLKLSAVDSLSGLKSFFVTPLDNLLLIRDKNKPGSIIRIDTLHYKVFIYGEWSETYGFGWKEAIVAYIDPFWVLDGYAKKNDASKLHFKMLEDTGADDLNEAKLADYKTAISAATEIPDMAALQTIIDTVNAA